jgi:hypothetical protein
MNAPADFTVRQLNLLAVKSRELADRVAAEQLAFVDAVDMAYSAALWSGVVDSAGDDAVQKVLAAAFMEIPRRAA